MGFLGGSAYAMASQICEGFVLVTERTFKQLDRSELEKLGFELEKRLREVRSEQPALDDTTAIQHRNRRIQRLNTTVRMLQFHRSTRRGR